ncbi:hypothetical protein GGR58DRAFT_509296 [Xylaria digitata]|nr:hypothetical protein GGR58DRAFT_509296 [Xylaria digitata]
MSPATMKTILAAAFMGLLRPALGASCSAEAYSGGNAGTNTCTGARLEGSSQNSIGTSTCQQAINGACIDIVEETGGKDWSEDMFKRRRVVFCNILSAHDPRSCNYALCSGQSLTYSHHQRAINSVTFMSRPDFDLEMNLCATRKF